ncbi:unnamed protein product [Linum tenue]|uniref:Uncharacterized protein n=2 Tax=Linum tenue TaxID=586396 RepID=A0AAV0KSY5_9ROSI|nr:unnamed protein product [Linum tenue]
MLSTLVTLMVDSVATSIYTSRVDRPPPTDDVVAAAEGDREAGNDFVEVGGADLESNGEVNGTISLMFLHVLELGIVLHSALIGLSLEASNNTCTIKGLVAALCFHQMFEGMGLGGCILQADYNFAKRMIMAFFFATTTPFGILVGLGLSKTYKENSPTALIISGLLNASTAWLLIYMALVDLLAGDFMGPKMQGSISLQLKSFVVVLLGAGGMSLMAKWA